MQTETAPAQARPPWSALGLGIVLAAAGVAGLVQMARDPLLADIDAGAADPGPAFFPRILLMLLVASGLAQIAVASWRAIRGGGFVGDREFAWRRLAVPVALAASVFVYAKSLPLVGYVAATAAFALLWLSLIGWIDRSLPASPTVSIALVVAEAAVISSILYAIFGYGIAVPLP